MTLPRHTNTPCQVRGPRRRQEHITALATHRIRPATSHMGSEQATVDLRCRVTAHSARLTISPWLANRELLCTLPNARSAGIVLHPQRLDLVRLRGGRNNGPNELLRSRNVRLHHAYLFD